MIYDRKELLAKIFDDDKIDESTFTDKYGLKNKEILVL